MKKVIYAFIAILVIVVVGIIFINENKTETDVTKEKTKVGFLLNGTCRDASYGQSHYEGIESVAKKLNLDINSNAELSVKPASDEIYVFPIPEEEFEYRTQE